jgi:multiple sugar transport system substrate-binding protein
VGVKRHNSVRVALIGGPMYDPLYDSVPRFEQQTGLRVEVVARLPHPALNAFVRGAFEEGGADLDLVSTHTKYAPSQAAWLASLDDLVPVDTIADLLPQPAELSRIDGGLLQVPRNLDVRLLHVRRDLLNAVSRPVPDTWQELAEAASALTSAGVHGFLFPGRDSGLFGTFYELLVGAGGDLFDEALYPVFDSPAGEWAAAFLADLHLARRVTPRDLPGWHYDEISAAFRAGHAAMVGDWPGSYHLYTNPHTCVVFDQVELALLPRGPAGARAAYAGCHSFAIPRDARNPRGAAALLTFFTSFESQLAEARLGAIPCRTSALQRIREEASGDRAAATRWQLLAETGSMMIIPPRFAAYPRCEDAIWQAVQRAMVGEWSPREAVRRAASEIRTIVDAHAPAR